MCRGRRGPRFADPQAARLPIDPRPVRRLRLTVDDDAAPLAVTDDPAFGWLLQDVDRGDGRPRTRSSCTTRLTADDASVVDSREVRSHEQSYVHVPVLAAMLQPEPHVLVDGAHVGRTTARPARTRRSRTSTRACATTTGRRSWIRRPGAEQQAARGLLAVPQGRARRPRARSCGHASLHRPATSTTCA